MNRIVKYSIKLYKKIDISPFGGNNLTFKLFVFLLWCICAVFFTTKELISDEHYSSPIFKNCYLSVTKQYSCPDVIPDGLIGLNDPPCQIILILYTNKIVLNFLDVESNRAPPYFFYSHT